MGCIHIYFGNGKGKTTAAAGLALRALGTGMPVVVAQFLKHKPSGEIRMLAEFPGVTIFLGKAGSGFTNTMTTAQREETLAIHLRHFAQATLVAQQQGGLLVLDEILGAIETGLFPEDALIQFLKARPDTLEVVLTGRSPSDALLALGDYLTEMRCLRHPYEKGIGAREGIEY